jgi:hypothetical protein
VEEVAMRHWAPILLPIAVTAELLVALSVFPDAATRILLVTTAALVVATVITAVFTKYTAARVLLATLAWSLVLFEVWPR